MSNPNPPHEPSGEGCVEFGCGCLVIAAMIFVFLLALWLFKKVWMWL